MLASLVHVRLSLSSQAKRRLSPNCPDLQLTNRNSLQWSFVIKKSSVRFKGIKSKPEKFIGSAAKVEQHSFEKNSRLPLWYSRLAQANKKSQKNLNSHSKEDIKLENISFKLAPFLSSFPSWTKGWWSFCIVDLKVCRSDKFENRSRFLKSVILYRLVDRKMTRYTALRVDSLLLVYLCTKINVQYSPN